MNKPFGAQGKIINFPFKDLHETFYNQDSVELEINDGVLYVGVDNEANLERAKDFARLYLAAWSERQQIKITVDFNHAWQTNSQEVKNHRLELGDSVKPVERLQAQTTTHQITIKTTASIVTQQMHDSASFTHDTRMINKALNNAVLRNALMYFNEDIINDDKPLIGIYKAIQEIAIHLGTGSESKGQEELAKLAGENVKYVKEITETAQIHRHSQEWLAKKKAKAVLTEEVCRERAKILIDAFASSLS